MAYEDYNIAPNFNVNPSSGVADYADYGMPSASPEISSYNPTDTSSFNLYQSVSSSDPVAAFLDTNNYINNSWINPSSSDTSFTQLKSVLDTGFSDTSMSNDLATVARTEDKSMAENLSDKASSAWGSVKDAYGNLDNPQKEFVWKTAAGMLAAMATASTRSAQAKAQTLESQAYAKNADTNRLTYQLAADEKAKDRANAANVWNGVPAVAPTPYSPAGLLNADLSKRIGV